MASKHLLDTKTVSVYEILGNGKIYKVPLFQRDYSWGQDQLEDLWNDLLNAYSSETPHYMGAVVLKANSNKEFEIIDGQQRFATISILILAIINAIRNLAINGIDTIDNEEREKLLMNQFIEQKEPSSLRNSSKLFLNENNNNFYQTRLLKFKGPINEHKLSHSESLLWDAYQFYQNKISEEFQDYSGDKLSSFLTTAVGELMMFIQITVEDEMNAYTVFETLNSRGVDLTSTDLLKNYLFSKVAGSETDLNNVKELWKKIITIIGLKDFPTFLRYYLLATRKQLTKDYLFKEIKNHITNADDVFELLENLEKYAYNYVALGNSDDDTWKNDKEITSAITILKTLRVTQWKPLAMVACIKYKPNSTDFKTLLQAIIAISYRYNVIAKMQTNEMEKVYSKAAINLHNSQNHSIKNTINDLKDLYVNDEDFKKYFELKQFDTNNSNDKKMARYTLYKLESQISDGNLYDYETDKGTIEHILPESYGENWDDFFSKEEYERNVYMIGNLTLLEANKNNKDAANKPFEDKKEVYQTSKYHITNTIDDINWTIAHIKNRQERLAKIATGIWKIQF